MPLRVCLAVVLLCAACSSSGGASPTTSSSSIAASLPAAVSCSGYAHASSAEREAWSSALLDRLTSAGEIEAPADQTVVSSFAAHVVKLCADSAASDKAEQVATSLARQALGR